MSADAWESCPICNGLPEKLRGGYKHLYGKVSEEEYNKIKRDYECELVSTPVRVDYEYTLKEDKTIFLTFYAECEICGAKWEQQGVVSMGIPGGRGIVNLELDEQYLCEVFEILCSIPYEKASANDPEPPTLRYPGIEQILNQIAEVLNA